VLRKNGHIFEKDGATWLRTTDFTDDKDRVIIRSNGEKTYFAADCAYYINKRERGFDRCLYLLGADHHGYIGRLKAIAACAGDDPEKNIQILIGQLVNLMRGGEPVRLSKRAGTIILGTTVILWALASIPQAGPGQKQSEVSIAGHIANGIEVVVKPIGFNHDIALALLPAMAAREVAVSAIATVYSLDASGDPDAVDKSLADKLRHRWSLPTALAFLAWFVFAPQCISTIAVTRRETNGWKWPLFMVSYLFVLAYIAAGLTYWTAMALGL